MTINKMKTSVGRINYGNLPFLRIFRKEELGLLDLEDKCYCMNIKEAQKDLRQSYYNGATGALVSGTLWTVSGVVALLATQEISILVFFFGGMLIFPLSMLVAKALKRSGQHQKGNPLATLSMESTLLLFIGLFIAYLVYQNQPDWFYGVMLLMIGGRYVVFQSIYGMRVYWLFGLSLILAGVWCILFNQPFHIGALVGGGIELLFAIFLFRGK